MTPHASASLHLDLINIISTDNSGELFRVTLTGPSALSKARQLASELNDSELSASAWNSEGAECCVSDLVTN